MCVYTDVTFVSSVATAILVSVGLLNGGILNVVKLADCVQEMAVSELVKLAIDCKVNGVLL